MDLAGGNQNSANERKTTLSLHKNNLNKKNFQFKMISFNLEKNE